MRYEKQETLISIWEYKHCVFLDLRLGTPLLLGGLLRYFKKGSEETYESALLYASGICIATAISVITINQTIFSAFHIGAKVRVAACSVVYRKVCELLYTYYI